MINESSHRARIVALVLATMASQALLVVLGPTIVAIGVELGGSVGAVGQARTITAAVAIPVSLLLTGRMEYVGVRRAIIIGASVAVAACAAVALSGTLPLFLLAHVATGLAFALLLSGGFAGAADLPPERRTGALGYIAGANALAWIVVNPLAGLLTAKASWRVAQAMPAGLAVAALGAAVAAIPTSTRRPGGRPAVRLRELLGVAPARRWVYSETIAYFAWTGFLSFAGAFLIETLGLGEATVGWLLTTGPAAYVAAATGSARLPGTLPRRWLVAGAAFIMAALLVAQFTWSDSLVWATIGFCLIGAVGGVRTPASAGLGMALGQQHGGAMMAVRTAAIQLGYLLGAAVGGAMIESSGYGALGAALACGMVVSGLLVLTIRDQP